jgi:hypothetical protein
MQNASNSAVKRKRGGQPGNCNRLLHGRYTQAEAASRADIRSYRRKGRALVILVNNILKARAMLKRRLAARALAAQAAAAHPRRPLPLRSKPFRARPRNSARHNVVSRCGRRRSRSPPKLSDGAFGARDPGGNIRNVTAVARL